MACLPMTFQSILFKENNSVIKKEVLEPNALHFLSDLNLDQIIDAITFGKEEYNLKPFFLTPLSDLDQIEYRHEIMQDVEKTDLIENLKSFAENMQRMRKFLTIAEKLYYKYQKERLFLDAVKIYCDSVSTLEKFLSKGKIKSQGFLAFREYLTNYLQSERFNTLYKETNKIIADLSSVKYCVHINGLRVQVQNYNSETDFSAEIEESFAKFKQGAVKNYLVKYSHQMEMNHVESQILDGVASLYPEFFLQLDIFNEKNRAFQDQTIVLFDREIQFYIAYLDYIATINKSLKFCYPTISITEKEVYSYDGFDLALAKKLIQENSSVICNDFYLQQKERILIISGPNQGGKTTFARTFGQLHYLASIGCPVPGRKAKFFLFDKLFTHFEKEESIKLLRGKLEDDLIRVNDILNKCTPNSIIIMNEIFTSTTLQDAIFLSKKILERIIQLDLLCVWVTFIDELASFSEQTISMVSTISAENPSLRTFKIVRSPANGLAYALSLAEKRSLTYKIIMNRIKL